MAQILIIGAGLSGCASALALANAGLRVVLVEKAENIGGKVRWYGCKATDKCNNCGLCLTAGIWEKVENHPLIEILLPAAVINLSGGMGNFSAEIKTTMGIRSINQIDFVMVCIGFQSINTGFASSLEIEGTKGIVTGTALEAMLMDRGETTLFTAPPKRVAFLQCFGSRNKKEASNYCSRVCCAYASRSAKVIKHYYPQCEITFFYMEFQSVAHRDYFKELQDMGIQFIKCRPLKLKGGGDVAITYDDPAAGLITKAFDMAVLSEGIHPGRDSWKIGEICGLALDNHGFLSTVSSQAGVYVAGCAKTPLKIEEAYGDAMAAAKEILALSQKEGGLLV